VAEVEDSTRVTVLPMGETALAGRAVGDIVHLLAELIENAVSFSPPYTQAQVSGHRVAHGYVIEIEDRGLGMTDEILGSINERVTDPPEFNLSSSAHLGLYVVGRLAVRYDIRVSLKHSSYGGTTAVVLVPHDLIVEGEPTSTTAPRGLPVTVGAAGITATSYSDVPARVRELAPAEETESAPVASAQPPVTFAPSPEAGTNGTRAPALPQRTSTKPVEEPPPAAPTSRTPGGLPVRVPQASLAPALRSDTPATPKVSENTTASDKVEEEVPSPEAIRRSFGGLQAGTRRGRNDAARSHAAEPDSPTDEEV
jgi:anti-sigma regulatory factor (Ser/Thr protein kinase)